MTVSTTVRASLLLGLIVGIGGCAAGGASPGTLAALTRTRSLNSQSNLVQKGDLLYVSTYNDDDLRTYSFPGGKLKQTITGFEHIGGLCTAPNGNVWVGDLDQVVEYKHGGTKPIMTLNNPEPSSFIGSCSVDPMTGDLAISNTPFGSASGNVGVYKNASGAPTYYQIFQPQQCSYDNMGNLYCDTYAGPSSGFRLYKLAAGKKSFTKVHLDRAIVNPGGVQWDGKYLAVGDAQLNVVYRFHMHGRKGIAVGSLKLVDGSDVNEFSIASSMLAGASSGNKSALIWPYPRGGKPATRISRLHVIGVTISLYSEERSN